MQKVTKTTRMKLLRFSFLNAKKCLMFSSVQKVLALLKKSSLHETREYFMFSRVALRTFFYLFNEIFAYFIEIFYEVCVLIFLFGNFRLLCMSHVQYSTNTLIDCHAYASAVYFCDKV